MGLMQWQPTSVNLSGVSKLYIALSSGDGCASSQHSDSVHPSLPSTRAARPSEAYSDVEGCVAWKLAPQVHVEIVSSQ